MNLQRDPFDYRGIEKVTSQGRVETPFSSAVLTNIVNLQLLGNIDLHTPLHFVPLFEAARKQIDILRDMGERVPENCGRFHVTTLLNQYLLCSTIMVVTNSNGDLSWVTKSPVALRTVFPDLVSDQQYKGITRLLAEAMPSYSEIVEGRFVVLRIVITEEGYCLERTMIPVEAKLLPYFILHTFRAKLIQYLRAEKVEISYKQGKSIEKILTSLRPKHLVSQFGFDPNGAEQFYPRDWHRGRAKLGYLSLPNLEKGKFQQVPLHRIVHISAPRM